jgi:sulfur-oxidizing protein SoxX
MPKPGSRRSRPKCSAEVAAGLAALVLSSLTPALALAEGLAPYRVVEDAIPNPLTGVRGDPSRGRGIVVDRQRGLCLLCHSGPFPEQRFQGNLAPSLQGAGSRWSEGQLRLRLVDSRRLNPATIMPPYFSTDELTRVGQAWQGKPVLSAADIEDVVAYLLRLKGAP